MKKRIVIIGGGVIGHCTALFCTREGHEVEVIDESDGEGGCSFGNAGMIVPSHFIPLAVPGMVWLGLKWMWNPESPFHIKPRLSGDLLGWGLRFWRAANEKHVDKAAPVLRDLHLMSRGIFAELAAEAGNDFGLVEKGLLVLCKTQPALHHEADVAARANSLGVPAEVLTASQTAALDPGVTMDVCGSVFFPRDCHLDPAKFMRSIRTAAMEAGARFRFGTRVSAAAVRGSREIACVRCGEEEMEADEFVLCAGAWSPSLARDMGLRLPMQAGKGYSLTLPQPPELPQICSILAEARVAVTPMGGSLRVGGTMEIAGNDLSINERRVRGIIRSMTEYFPRFKPGDFHGVRPWSGLRPCSPDGLPYLGRSERYRNLVIATGHAMLGLSLGPATGKIVAEIMNGKDASVEIGMLRPDRF